MKRSYFVRALLAGSAIVISGTAWAQDPAPAAPAAEEQPDQSDATADQAIQEARDLDDAQAKIELLQAQVEALQESITQIQAAQAKALPSWKGSPQLEDKDAGWSFKPKGLLQYDAGYVGFPNGDELRGTNAGLNYANLGWNTRARRLTIGADGSLPGGFRYSAEFNFAQSSVDFEDVLLAYDFKNTPITAQIGYFYPFSSLETMTSSKYTSFMERAGITDAFSHNRRIGAAIVANDKTSDKWVAQAGIFSEEMNNSDLNRTGWVFAARGVFSPTFGDAKMHFGLNYAHRENRQEAMARNYQARPTTQLTDQRFISTGSLASKGDDVLGFEAAGIFKQFHFAAEAQKVWVRGMDAAEFADINGDLESTETASGAILNGDPSLWGGYAEIGYYLTGETRAYKGGSFGRVKVLKPVDKGGWGAFQLNARIDYLDLNDRVADSDTFTAPNYVNGGKQIAYQASLIWNPTDYTRFMAQYAHINVTGGPRNPLSDDLSDPVNEREFDSDVFAMRAQIDF